MPLQQPTAEHFSNFEDHSNNLIGNLQLDDVEEPRRIGATSRANSVRFDETANHGHWAHASRSSLDLIPRTGSGLGGHAMSERSYSHKSDGRQSSAGQSVHSATSERANSLAGLGPVLPMEPPGLAPGLFILGSVPAIIRCWLDTNFKHNTLRYAAVCSGSFTSYLDVHLVDQLGFQDEVVNCEDGTRKLKLSLYLPEAVPVCASSRSNSPAPQLPSVVVEFTIIQEHDTAVNPKAIQIFLGSDMLRAHNADILFSTNQVTLYDEDRTKLQIPLVRPEDDRSFKSLSISSKPRQVIESHKIEEKSEKFSATERQQETARESQGTQPKANGFGTAGSSDDGGSVGRRSLEQRGLSTSFQSSEGKEASQPSSGSAGARPGPSAGIWSNWRRDSTEKTNATALDWANVGKTTSSSTNYKPRDTGIKVLRPTKTISRTMSTSAASPSSSQSRFFDDGKKRGESEEVASATLPHVKRTVSGEKGKEISAAGPKPRFANPVGGASAFAWLNSSGNK